MNTSEDDVASRKNVLIFTASRKGWIVAAEGDWGVQLSRGRIYNPMFLWIGLALAIFGVGILIWMWGYVDYLSQRDQVLLVSTKELAAGKLDGVFRRLR